MSDLPDTEENVRNAAHALRAYMRFHDRVAQIAIGMAEAGDPVSLQLLDAMRDLLAVTGELYDDDDGEDG